MKIAAMSDMHGFLPDVSRIKKVDVVVIAGDVFPLDMQRDMPACENWFKNKMLPWMGSLPAERVILIPGNHDFFFFRAYNHTIGFDMDTFLASEENTMGDRLVYLIDKGFEWGGKTFYGTPWVAVLHRWAFYAPCTADKWSLIPEGVDLLVTHMPPSAGMTGVTHPGTHYAVDYGDPYLTVALDAKGVKNHVCGHVHTGVHGGVKCGVTNVYNVSLKNEDYRVAYDVTYFEI